MQHPFLMDEGLLSSISAGYGQLVKIFANRMDYLITYTCFEIGRRNDKEKKKIYKEKILVIPGLKPLYARLLDYKKASATYICYIHWSNLPIYHLPVLIR